MPFELCFFLGAGGGGVGYSDPWSIKNKKRAKHSTLISHPQCPLLKEIEVTIHKFIA